MPPWTQKIWDDNPPAVQALLISYHQIRELEEAQLAMAMVPRY